MANGYQHLSGQERAVLLCERSRGSIARAISRLLGRSPSTMTRELARGSDPAAEAAYCPTQGAQQYCARRHRCSRPAKLIPGSARWPSARPATSYCAASQPAPAQGTRFQDPRGGDGRGAPGPLEDCCA
ncbi:MAG: helix-turn-helix domain-containing protein [Halorhodospira sp.]